ncbi:tenomodulin [Bufo gargarizans]|uniref:tenomodulin n=1 Tax=Bufo gargarizans TaxID=30331 RepID=UPI001CF4288A|nr:tenomodulin [Bufo gargarizans]
MKKEDNLEEQSLQQGEISKPQKKHFKKCAILAISVCLLMILSLLTLLVFVKDFWKQKPEKVYDVEYKFLSDGEKTTVLMEIDPRNKIETFRMENGTDNAVEIHDFKHGITGIYFAGFEKCFIKTQSKEIPAVEATELEVEEGEITTTIYEQSMFWIPSENPIEDTDFLKNSKILELCHNKSLHWIFPSSPSAPEFQDFDDGEDDESEAEQQVFSPKDQRGKRQSGKRQSRSLTEEDLPVNDYREVGLDFHPSWDNRGFCCTHCRRGQRYCRKVCEPLLGYYPYPYCYGSGRVICRIIMPCNWWVARMLGRV